MTAAQTKGTLNLDPKTLAEINELLIQSERKLILPSGLPGRSWYKNQIHAPGAYTGYGVKTLPGVREAMDQGDWKLAEEQIPVVAKVIEDEAVLIDTVTGLLGGAATTSKGE